MNFWKALRWTGTAIFCALIGIAAWSGRDHVLENSPGSMSAPVAAPTFR